MNKKDFVDELSTRTGMSKKQTTEVFDTIIELMVESIKESGTDKAGFRVSDFGMFYVKKRAARDGQNPRTGEKIHIPSQNAVTFRPSKSLKEQINNVKVTKDSKDAKASKTATIKTTSEKVSGKGDSKEKMTNKK